MKTAITFTAAPEHPSGSLLLHIAILLHQMRINPESLIWTAADGSGVWLWMIVVREELRVRELVRALESTDGARNVRVESVPGGLTDPLPPGKSADHPPFMD